MYLEASLRLTLRLIQSSYPIGKCMMTYSMMENYCYMGHISYYQQFIASCYNVFMIVIAELILENDGQDKLYGGFL